MCKTFFIRLMLILAYGFIGLSAMEIEPSLPSVDERLKERAPLLWQEIKAFSPEQKEIVLTGLDDQMVWDGRKFVGQYEDNDSLMRSLFCLNALLKDNIKNDSGFKTLSFALQNIALRNDGRYLFLGGFWVDRMNPKTPLINSEPLFFGGEDTNIKLLSKMTLVFAGEKKYVYEGGVTPITVRNMDLLRYKSAANTVKFLVFNDYKIHLMTNPALFYEVLLVLFNLCKENEQVGEGERFKSILYDIGVKIEPFKNRNTPVPLFILDIATENGKKLAALMGDYLTKKFAQYLNNGTMQIVQCSHKLVKDKNGSNDVEEVKVVIAPRQQKESIIIPSPSEPLENVTKALSQLENVTKALLQSQQLPVDVNENTKKTSQQIQSDPAVILPLQSAQNNSETNTSPTSDKNRLPSSVDEWWFVRGLKNVGNYFVYWITFGYIWLGF